MAWIESHQELARHPKTKRLARILNVSLPAVVGHLHFLWWWALDYAQDGDLTKFDKHDIADACGWDGDSKELLEALIDSGFVDREDDELFIHDWDEYAGRLLDKRKANTERKRKSRASHARQAQDVQDGHGATEPNLTIPNQNNTTTAAHEESQETFAQAYKRVNQRDLTSFQAEQIGSYIDDGITEPVVIRAIERAGLSSGGGVKLILKILNDYTAVNANTLESAIAFDAEFDARKSRGDPRRTPRQQQMDDLDEFIREEERRGANRDSPPIQDHQAILSGV